jgi:hypothetical protein
MQQIVKAFVVGVVGIGLATALVMNGRQTANVIKAGGGATSQVLGTAIKG